jgi:hypothetical protein
MAINTKQRNPETTKDYRRRGGAFDTLAKFLRSIEQAVFKNGSIIEDRPGDISIQGVDAPSVFEIYQQKPADMDKFNLMFVGRKGTGEGRNENYIELVADAKTDSKASFANGQIRMAVSIDGQESYSGVVVVATETFPGAVGNGPAILLQSHEGDGANSLAQIGHFGADGALKFAIVLDSDGIQMFGLPTSNPGGSNRVWSDGGTLKIT